MNKLENYDTGNQPTQPCWDTDQLIRDFEVIGFVPPYVMVKRRSDGVQGLLEFTHRPRVYFDFRPESVVQ